jgi:hypothetical protein
MLRISLQRSAANDNVRKYLKNQRTQGKTRFAQCVAVLVDYVIPAPKITFVL